MHLKGKKIGFALTGSHCTLNSILPVVRKLVDAGAEVFPIFSQTVLGTDTRFGTAEHWKTEMESITGKKIIASIVEAEPIGPKALLDVIVVAPCTGNTLAKIANGIVDSPVLMAVKSQLRNQRPVILAISTNDGLGMNAKNIGLLLNIKNMYMVPFGQDDPQTKPNSLVAHMDVLPESVEYALDGKQIQPMLVQYRH
ncbi:MAG: dipicolinate synthase subunit B [Bacillota bacterium]